MARAESLSETAPAAGGCVAITSANKPHPKIHTRIAHTSAYRQDSVPLD